MATGKLQKKTGTTNNPNGRPKGVPNKATATAREAIARFVDGNAHRLAGWLDEIAETDGPKAAYLCFMDVVEYHVPKLARTEVSGIDGKAIVFQLSSDEASL